MNIERCSIVGLSVGGMWGAIAALLAPERITGLVLMDTYLGKETEAKKAYYFSLLDKLEEVGSFPEPLLDIVVPIFFRPGIDPQSPVYTSFRAALAGMNAEQLRQSVVPLGRMIFGRDDRLGLIEQLNADTTLVMCGDADIPRPPEETREMANLIGCPYVLVPEAGHIANLENPAFVSDALMTFWRGLTRSRVELSRAFRDGCTPSIQHAIQNRVHNPRTHGDQHDVGAQAAPFVAVILWQVLQRAAVQALAVTSGNGRPLAMCTPGGSGWPRPMTSRCCWKVSRTGPKSCGGRLPPRLS